MKGLLLAVFYIAVLVLVSGCSHLTVHVHIALAEKVELRP
jgi:hypothetical protein